MALSIRWRKVLRNSAVVLLVLAAGMAAFVQIRQHILRWRAERLLADIRALQLGKSTWADAQRIMTRWGAWGFYEGSCTEKRCNYQIVMEDIFSAYPVYSMPDGRLRSDANRCCNWMIWPYRLLGGRPVLVGARLEVINQTIWGKHFELAMDVPRGIGRGQMDYILIASADTVWRTEDYHHSPSQIHPDYLIGSPSGCTVCEAVYTKFTPFVDPGTARSLMQFNLECIDQIIPCRDQGDIMPTAWKQYEAGEQNYVSTTKTNQSPADGCALSAEFLGRDRRNVVTAEVITSETKRDFSGTDQVVSFRLKERLKRSKFWKLGDVAMAILPNYVVTGNGSQTGLIAPEHEVILAIGAQYDLRPDWVNLDPCDVLPLTDQNLDAIRRGISQDIFPSDDRR